MARFLLAHRFVRNGLATAVAVLFLAFIGSAARDRMKAADDGARPVEQVSGGLSVDERNARLNATRLMTEGRQAFRHDTFGSEAFWGGLLRLHEAIAAAVSPEVALSVGLKVDSQAIRGSLMRDLEAGRVDLTSPATTVALLRRNAVVGVQGFFENGELTSVGIQCALCHSTVDDSFAPGIGRRLDGRANRDLNVGAIIALAPNLRPFGQPLGVDDDTVRQVAMSWGPGKFDASLLLDGKAFRPDGPVEPY